jgi:hypothetical protein
MKSEAGIRILLLFLVLVTGSFDRHLSGYFHGEVKALVQHDAVPFSHQVPIQACDNHEDITLKQLGTFLPSPMEAQVTKYRILQVTIPCSPPLALWQPPESVV